MRNIGTYEYVIGVIHDKDIWYYVGGTGPDGKKLAPGEKYSSSLSDAKRYGDEVLSLNDLPLITNSLTRKILEIQKCPKCGKKFTEYLAISRDDNVAEICPECGMEESLSVLSIFLRGQ